MLEVNPKMPNAKVLSEKQAIVAELTEKLTSAASGVLVDYKGISVEDDTKLRKELREAGVHYVVEKNSMLRFAFKNMGIDVVIEKMIKSDKVLLHLHGKNLGILIGKHGQTLDALQYLTNLTTNQGETTRHFIMLDVENYRHRREETLKQLAIRLANRVKKSGDRVVLEPMNGYERKIIHVTLQNDPQVRTESEGQDPYRHVVIYSQE